VKIWEAQTGQEVQALPGRNGWPAAWAPDGRRLAVHVEADGQRRVAVYAVAPGENPAELRRHREEARALLWTADGQRLLLGGLSGTVVWDPDNGAELLKLPGTAHHLSWAPDGTLVVEGPAGRVFHEVTPLAP
jgi:WD40 repeat protein